MSSGSFFDLYYTQSLTILGRVVDLDTTDPQKPVFKLQPRVGNSIPVVAGSSTNYATLTNLDGVNRDRYILPDELKDKPPSDWATVYLPDGVLVAVEGIHARHEGKEIFEARRIRLLQQALIERGTQVYIDVERQGEGRLFFFENTYWWIAQIQRMADKWLDDLFGERRDYQLADFAALYRTNLDILGEPTDDNAQEMATLSRLIFGLSSAYLITGIDRYYYAAKAGVDYQREAFRGASADQRFCFWASAKRRMKHGSQYVMTSQNPDDRDTVPLYEQIYALAGMAQFYRITNDRSVLQDIRTTIQSFQQFFHDNSHYKGWFSHLDYVTFSPRHRSLKATNNDARKNWNSIGDHIPAYLINLILALDPVPAGREDLEGFLSDCRRMLMETTDLICEYFPQRNPDGTWQSDYVQERYREDWSADTTWGWQQDRAIVGHNLKIAWNLTRAANYFLCQGDAARAKRCMEVADALGQRMATKGLDPLRGGCFDAVERHPSNGMPVQFAWGNTKDFWQQEQGILAYLILHGNSTQPEQVLQEYKQYAREMMAFWNLYFLDHENQGIYFRTTENGQPVISGGYGNKAGHSVAGYHSFELNYLAHIYLRSYFTMNQSRHQRFALYFRPDPSSRLESINVLPDFFRPGAMTLCAININSRRIDCEGRTNFQVQLDPTDAGGTVVAEFQPK